MTLPRPLKWMAGALLALAVLFILFLVFFDWNWMRDPIERRVSAATGRSFEINGDLKVSLSLTPRVIVNDMTLGNMPGSREASMVRVKILDFKVDLLKLFTGRLDLPELALTAPHVLLELDAAGDGNWRFDSADGKQAFDYPDIGHLAIHRGKVVFLDRKKNTELDLDVNTLEPATADAETRLEIAGKGRYNGLPTTLHAMGGALLSARVEGEKPYPIEAHATFGSTRARIKGTLLDPLHFTSQQLDFTLAGSDLAQLYPLFGVPFPPTPAYTLAGFLDHAGKRWTFRGLKGVVGESDLAGDFAVDRAVQPQKITATLVSKKLLMRDLGGFVGARPGKQPDNPVKPGGRILPTEPFTPEKLRIADADVHFRGEQIITEKMPLENMRTHLIVKAGVLTLAPLDFGAAGGHLVAQVEMDGRRTPIATRVDVVARGLDLAKMFPNSKLAANNTGTMGGRAKLLGNGSSVAELLATANGEAALIMDGGSVGELTLRLANLDLANSLLLMIGGDKQAPISCMVGNFNAVNGLFTAQELVLDTPKVNITGTGNVNLADETLHLRLVARSKGFSLASLRGPVAIGGTLTNPIARPELGGVVVRGGAAVALGVVTAGIGALLPLLDFGKQKDSDCSTLVREAKADVGVKAADMLPGKSRSSTARTAPKTRAVPDK